MSHEGIRFVSPEEAGEEAREMMYSREATEPARVRVDKTKGTGMEIDWKDGHQSRWTFVWLRDACPCATCHQEREAAGREPGEPKPQPATPLPMFKAPARPESVSPVGRYAISFHWNDGHTSGIFSWNYLRSHCQCDQCRGSSSR